MNFRFIFVALLLIILPTDIVRAVAPDNFVTCNGPDCSLCNLAEMANIIIVWLFGVIFIIFGVIAVIAGFGLVTSAGNQSSLDAAKSKLTNAVIGLVIVMAAWLLIDTIMRGLMSGAEGTIEGWGPWMEVSCQEQTEAIEGGDTSEEADAGGTPVDPDIVAECDDDDALMAKYGGSPVGVEAPGLRDMINCYLADPAVDAATDKGQLYTFDRSNPRCALTNGNTVCGPCSHSNNSMHYGRGSGQGAMAVDFNASGVSESELNSRLRARQPQCGGTLLFETSHTHISL